MPVEEAARMLKVDSAQQFAQQRNWQRDPTGQHFIFSQEKKNEDLHFIKNSVLICQGLGYARELEKIV